jgi:methylphosphotriester-DNA--protein-cysteine methyltransferase
MSEGANGLAGHSEGAAQDHGAPFSYRELQPSAELEHLVSSYWEFAVLRKRDGQEHGVFPDGCLSITYRRDASAGTSWLRVGGPFFDAFAAELGERVVFWGARVSPAALGLVLQRRADALQNRSLPAEQVFGDAASELHRALDRADSFFAAIELFAGYLRSRGFRPEAVDRAVAQAVHLIDDSQGVLRIAEAAARVGLGARQLGRRFRAAAGLTPKQYARARRLRAIAIGLAQQRAHGRGAGWASKASELGFSDQAHLSRELVSLTGRPPNRFAHDLAAIEHGLLVE